MKHYNEFKGNYHVRRAIEVALSIPAGEVTPKLVLVGTPRSDAFPMADCEELYSLVDALSPCPCGYHSDPKRECWCDVESEEFRKHRYPFQFYAMAVEVTSVDFRELSSSHKVESWKTVRSRVDQAEKLYPSIPVEMDRETASLLEQAYDTLGFEPQDVDQILAVSRAVAALEGDDKLQSAHVLEAIQYKSFAVKLSDR